MSCADDMHTKSNSSAVSEVIEDPDEEFLLEEQLDAVHDDTQSILALLHQHSALLTELSNRIASLSNSNIPKRLTSHQPLSLPPMSTSSVSTQSMTPTPPLAAINPTDTTSICQSTKSNESSDLKSQSEHSSVPTIRRCRLKPVSVHSWSQVTTSALSSPSTAPAMGAQSAKSLAVSAPSQRTTPVTQPLSQPTLTQEPPSAKQSVKS